jgi:HPt (histidine-containing phosphotransfer) domain-containing protein
VDAVVEEAPLLAGRVRDALEAGDCQSLQRAAHALGGTMRAFEAVVLIRLATDLEEKGRGGDLTCAERICDDLHRELDGALDELRAFRSPGSSSSH